MDQWQAIVITAIVGAIAYLFNSDKMKARALASIEVTLKQIVENQSDMRKQISEDQHEMKERQEEIKKRQEEIDAKLNLFIKTEVDTLKELARQGFTRNKGA